MWQREITAPHRAAPAASWLREHPEHSPASGLKTGGCLLWIRSSMATACPVTVLWAAGPSFSRVALVFLGAGTRDQLLVSSGEP